MNSTTITDYENEILDNIEAIIYIMTGIAICVALSFMRKVLDNIIALVKCIYDVLTCCRYRKHVQLSNSNEV